MVENPIKRVYGSVAVEEVATGPDAGKVSVDRDFTGEMVCTYGSDQPVVKARTATTETPQKIDDVLVGFTCAITETAPTAAPVQDNPSTVWLPVNLPAGIHVTANETPATVADAQYSFNWMCTSAGFTSPLSATARIANGEVWQLPVVVLIPRGSSCTGVEAPESRPDTIDGAYSWDLVKSTVTGATGTVQGASTTFLVPTDDTKVLVVAANLIARSYGEFAVTKSSNLVSGAQLKVGQSVTYSLTVVNKTLTNMVLGTGDVPPTPCATTATTVPSDGSSVPATNTARARPLPPSDRGLVVSDHGIAMPCPDGSQQPKLKSGKNMSVRCPTGGADVTLWKAGEHNV